MNENTTWVTALVEYIKRRGIPTPGEYFGFREACRMIGIKDIPSEKGMPNLAVFLKDNNNSINLIKIIMNNLIKLTQLQRF